MRVALVIVLIAIMVVLGIGLIKLLLGSIGVGEDVSVRLGAGTDGGVYRSTDGGVTFVQSAQAGDTNFARYDIFALVEDPEQPGTWWAATEGAGLFRSHNQGESWEAVWGQDDILKKAVVRAFVRGRGEATLFLSVDAGGRGRIWKSVDGGKTFIETYSAARDGVIILSIALPRQNPDVLLAGLSDGLLIGSTDEGLSWTALTQFPGPITQMQFTPSDPSIVYAIVARGGIMRSADRGATWEDLTRFSPQTRIEPQAQEKPLSQFARGREVYSIAVHPADPNDLLFATGSGLLRSRDGGHLFRQLPVPLRPEALPVRAAAFDPSNRDTLLATAGDGVYVSFDGGTNWRVTRLTLHPKLTFIVVSVADRTIILLGTGDR